MAETRRVTGAELADRYKDDADGIGESSIGATERQAGGMLGATPFGAGAGSLAGLDGGGIAAEALALGGATRPTPAETAAADEKESKMNQQQDPGAIEADRREEEARQTGGTTGDPGSPGTATADPGDPGGLGGVRTQGSTGTGRPPGGASPVSGRDRGDA